MWNASVALCRPGAPAANVACGPARASHRQANQHQGHRCSQCPAGTCEHHATVCVEPTLRTWANMTVWPSGLRRWLQAPVRKGVGSNPTAVKSASAELDSLCEGFRGKPAAPMGSMQRSFYAEDRAGNTDLFVPNYPVGCVAPGSVPCQRNTRGSLSKPSIKPPRRKIMRPGPDPHRPDQPEPRTDLDLD